MIIKVTPSRTLSDTEPWTPAKLNQMASPIVEVEPHTVGAVDLDAQAVRDIISGSAAGADSERKNFLINGTFNLWQRGNTFASTVGGPATRYYTADRWAVQLNTPSRTILRSPFTQPTGGLIPGHPLYYLRWIQTAATAPTVPFLQHPIEGVRTLAGQKATLSVYLLTVADVSITMQLVQNFGTGGSPSANVVVASSAIAVTGSATLRPRISWTFDVPELTGKTLGTNGDDQLEVRFLLPSGAAFDIYFAQAQLEKGDTATAVEIVDAPAERRRAERYYERVVTRLSSAITTHTPTMYYKTRKRVVVQPNTLSITGDPVTPYAAYFTALDDGTAYQGTAHALATTVQEIDAEFY